MKKLITIAICLGTLAFTGQAGAAITYDFSTMGYSEGQALEGLNLDFATFTSESGALNYTSNYGGGLWANTAATADLYIDFSMPINYISVTGGNGAGDYDAFSLYLYEFGTNSFLGRYDTPVFGGAAEPEWYTLSLSVSNVGFVLFDPGNSGSLPGDSSKIGGVVMTDLSYIPIPAPGAILLGGIGVCLVGWLRRRRTL